MAERRILTPGVAIENKYIIAGLGLTLVAFIYIYLKPFDIIIYNYGTFFIFIIVGLIDMMKHFNFLSILNRNEEIVDILTYFAFSLFGGLAVVQHILLSSEPSSYTQGVVMSVFTLLFLWLGMSGLMDIVR